MSQKQTTGSRAMVMHGTAKKTSGGLTKSQLKYNKRGKIVSKKASALAKKNNRLVNAGFVTKKGEFGTVMKGGLGDVKIKLKNVIGKFGSEWNHFKNLQLGEIHTKATSVANSMFKKKYQVQVGDYKLAFEKEDDKLKFIEEFNETDDKSKFLNALSKAEDKSKFLNAVSSLEELKNFHINKSNKSNKSNVELLKALFNSYSISDIFKAMNAINYMLTSSKIGTTTKLGNGAQGTIYSVAEKPLILVKSITQHKNDSEHENQDIEREMMSLLFKHPNIINVSHYYIKNNSYNFILERGDKSLRDLFKLNGVCTTHLKYKYLIDIALGLQYLKSIGIIHRDIKPDNIILVKQSSGLYIAKIIDFGTIIRTNNNKTYAGTLYYINKACDDTMLHGQSDNPEKCNWEVDLYAFGIIMYQVLFNKLEHKALNEHRGPGFFTRENRAKWLTNLLKLNLDDIQSNLNTSEIGNVLNKCCSNDRYKRYESLIIDLTRLQDNLPS